MTKNDEKRVSKAIRKADSRKKCLMLVNDIAEASLRGTRLLTNSDTSDIERSIRATAGVDAAGNYIRSNEQRVCADMLNALWNLSLCLIDVQAESLDAKGELAKVTGLFILVHEYQHFSEYLNELCWTRSGAYNARLQERAVSISQLVPYFYNMSLREEDDAMRVIDLKLPDEGSSTIFEVIERAKQKSSRLKALIKAMRDVMSQKQVPINVIIERIDDFEEEMRERIRAIKRILYRTDFEGWEELRATLVTSASPKLAMMDALPDYDDLLADQAEYEQTLFLLNQKSPMTVLGR
ncbi:MAG: hypothetical protein ABSC87_08970 [Halobacteriota archaeon]